DAVSAQVSPSVASVLERGMSQKRDDRYASAEDMREALRVAAMQPGGEAASVLTSAGVETNAIGNEARTVVIDEATQVRSATAETATVVRAAPGPGSSRKWMVAVAAVLVLAGVATAVLIRRALQTKAAEVPTTQNPTPPVAEATPMTTASPDNSIQSVTTQPKDESPKT